MGELRWETFLRYVLNLHFVNFCGKASQGDTFEIGGKWLMGTVSIKYMPVWKDLLVVVVVKRPASKGEWWRG